MKNITVHYDQKPIYDIVISESFDSLLDELNKLNIKDKRVCIISEDNVAVHYLPIISNILYYFTFYYKSFCRIFRTSN